MKSLLLFASLILSVLFTFPQEKKSLDDIIKECKEQPDDFIESGFPNLSRAIKNTLASDQYLQKVYYGKFEGRTVIHATSMKGLIVTDQNALLNNSTLDNISVWNFYMSVGGIHYNKDNPSALKYQVSFNRFNFALDKATSIAINENYCGVLQVGMKNIESAAEIAKDENVKQAATDIQKETTYTNALNVLKKMWIIF